MRPAVVLCSIVLAAGTVSVAFAGPASADPAVCQTISGTTVCLEHNTPVGLGEIDNGIAVRTSPVGDAFVGLRQTNASGAGGTFKMWELDALLGGELGLVVGQTASTGPTGHSSDTRALIGIPANPGAVGVEEAVTLGQCVLTVVITPMPCPAGVPVIPYIDIPMLP